MKMVDSNSLWSTDEQIGSSIRGFVRPSIRGSVVVSVEDSVWSPVKDSLKEGE